MICKNCGKELEAEEIICTQCNYDNTPVPEEVATPKVNPWKIAFPVTGSICLLLVLSFLLHFGVMGYWIPRGNSIYKKDSYSVDDERLHANRNTVVATLGKNKLTNAQLQIFYLKVCSDFKGQYSSSKPLEEQIYDEKSGLTWQQYLLEASLNMWKQYCYLTDMALEADFKLPEEYQKELDNLRDSFATLVADGGYSSVDELLSARFGEGCTFADYKYYLELNYYASLYYEELVAGITSTREEIEAFYKENEQVFEENGVTKDSGLLVDFRNIFVEAESNPDGITATQWEDCKAAAQKILDAWLSEPTEDHFHFLATEVSDDEDTAEKGGLSSYIYPDYLTEVDVRHILIMPEGGTKSEDGKTMVYSDEAWEACRKKAQEILSEYLNGEKTEEAFSELAKKYSQDGNAKDGGIYSDVRKDTMSENFDAWIFDESRKVGDTGLVKTQYGYHVMYFSHRDDALNDWLFDTERKNGDYTLVKTDKGYCIVYLMETEEGWIRIGENGLKNKKAYEMMEELSEQNQMSVKYGKIKLTK